MKYIFNSSTTQKTSIFLHNRRVDLMPNEFEPIDNDVFTQAQKLTLDFPALQIVDQTFIQNFLNNQNSIEQMNSQAQVATQIMQVASKPNDFVKIENTIPKPSIQAVLNAEGETVSVYNMPVFNSKGDLVTQIGMQYNEETMSLLVSSQDIGLSTISKLDKQKVIKEVEVEVISKEVVEDEPQDTLDSTVTNVGNTNLTFDKTTNLITARNSLSKRSVGKKEV